MPPPGEFGGGFAGADTKALPCWAWNAVVALLRSAAMIADVVEAILPRIPAPGPIATPGGKPGAPPTTLPTAQFCAIAWLDAENAATSARPPRITPRIFIVPPPKQISKYGRANSRQNGVNQAGRARKFAGVVPHSDR